MANTKVSEEKLPESVAASLVPQDSGSLGGQQSGMQTITAELVPSEIGKGLQESPLLALFADDRISTRATAVAVVGELLGRLRHKDQQLDAATREGAALRDSLAETRVQNARLSERVKQSNTTAPLVLGPLVFAIGVAIWQGIQGVPSQPWLGGVIASLGVLLVALALVPRLR